MHLVGNTLPLSLSACSTKDQRIFGVTAGGGRRERMPRTPSCSFSKIGFCRTGFCVSKCCDLFETRQVSLSGLVEPVQLHASMIVGGVDTIQSPFAWHAKLDWCNNTHTKTIASQVTTVSRYQYSTKCIELSTC